MKILYMHPGLLKNPPAYITHFYVSNTALHQPDL